MKKVGILTFHRAHNYGAMLQAYALSKKIGENYSVEIIDYYNKKIYSKYRVFKPLRKNPIKMAKQFLKDLIEYKKNKKRFVSFNNFLNENFVLSKQFNDNLKYYIEKLDYDYYITGSDQVWNPGIVGELSDIYTLNFDTKCGSKKISYAASIGDASLISKNKELYITKLSSINFLSVRELDAKLELEKILAKSVEEVLDPTLLLTKDEWNEKIKKFNNLNEKYILAYVVEPDSEYIKIVNDLSKKTGLKVIHFGLKNPGYNNVFKSAYTEGPLEFVNYIKNAEYVVATSFHATVFSIIFNKKFFVVPHRKTGARVTNLLEKLDIKNRVYYYFDEFKNIDYSFDTEWDKVSIILDSERKKSLNWLNNALKDEDDTNV